MLSWPSGVRKSSNGHGTAALNGNVSPVKDSDNTIPKFGSKEKVQPTESIIWIIPLQIADNQRCPLTTDFCLLMLWTAGKVRYLTWNSGLVKRTTKTTMDFLALAKPKGAALAR